MKPSYRLADSVLLGVCKFGNLPSELSSCIGKFAIVLAVFIDPTFIALEHRHAFLHFTYPLQGKFVTKITRDVLRMILTKLSKSNYYDGVSQCCIQIRRLARCLLEEYFSNFSQESPESFSDVFHLDGMISWLTAEKKITLRGLCEVVDTLHD
jgi:hypothetical protein